MSNFEDDEYEYKVENGEVFRRKKAAGASTPTVVEPRGGRTTEDAEPDFGSHILGIPYESSAHRSWRKKREQ